MAVRKVYHLVLLKFRPVTEVIGSVLTGSGECSEVTWRFLGLAMPAWVLICALGLGAFGVFTNTRIGKAKPVSFATR